VPCETQDPPNLNSDVGPAPTTKSSGKSVTSASPQENALTSRYADILSQLTDVKQLRAAGQDTAAKQLLDTALKQFANWSSDWAAFQHANGIKAPAPASPKGAKG